MVALASSGGQFDSIVSQPILNMEFRTQNLAFDGIELRLFKGFNAMIGYRASSTSSYRKYVYANDFFRIGENKFSIKRSFH